MGALCFVDVIGEPRQLVELFFGLSRGSFRDFADLFSVNHQQVKTCSAGTGFTAPVVTSLDRRCANHISSDQHPLAGPGVILLDLRLRFLWIS